MIELVSLTEGERQQAAKILYYMAKSRDLRIHDVMREKNIVPGAVLGAILRSRSELKPLPPLVVTEGIRNLTQALVDNGILARLTNAEMHKALGPGYGSASVYYWVRNLDKLVPQYPAVATPLVQQYAPVGTRVASTKRVTVQGKLWDVDMAAHGLPISGGTRLVVPENVAASA
jgi:hypothetical protein